MPFVIDDVAVATATEVSTEVIAESAETIKGVAETGKVGGELAKETGEFEKLSDIPKDADSIFVDDYPMENTHHISSESVENIDSAFVDDYPVKDSNLSIKEIENTELNIEQLEVTKHLPRTGGSWDGEVGNSNWIPDDDVVPKNRNNSNPEGKAWGEIKEKYDFEGVRYNNGYADFSEFSKGTVEIGNFTSERTAKGGNFEQANQKLAEQRGCSVEEVKKWMEENNYTWHECEDCKTMQKVPREVHNNIPHTGGVSIMKQNEKLIKS